MPNDSMLDLSQPLLPLTNDVVLKIFFGAEERRHLLIDLVNTILRLDAPIVLLEVINPAVTPEQVQQKGVILDIVALTAGQEHIQIEMQARSEAHFLARAFYYASRLHSSQLVRGNGYHSLRPSYSINLLNFNHFACKDPERYGRVLTLLDRETGEDHGPLLEMHFYELPKFGKFMRKNPHGSGSPHLDHWLQLFTNPADRHMERVMRTDPVIKDAMRHLKEISGDKQVQELARMREKAERDWISSMQAAEDRGRAEGEAKGRTEGEAKGEAAAKSRLLAALLQAPATATLSDSAMAELVGLPVEQVAVVRQNLKR